MTSFDWVYDDPDFKTFERAFKDKRLAALFQLYWGPIGLQWYALWPDKWTIRDLDVPGVPMPFGVDGANALMLYPEVKKVGALLSPTHGNVLYWNPRTGKWVSATNKAQPQPPNSVFPPCLGDMKRELKSLDQLYDERTLMEEEWREQRNRVIESCLGKTKGGT